MGTGGSHVGILRIPRLRGGSRAMRSDNTHTFSGAIKLKMGVNDGLITTWAFNAPSTLSKLL